MSDRTPPNSPRLPGALSLDRWSCPQSLDRWSCPHRAIPCTARSALSCHLRRRRHGLRCAALTSAYYCHTSGRIDQPCQETAGRRRAGPAASRHAASPPQREIRPAGMPLARRLCRADWVGLGVPVLTSLRRPISPSGCAPLPADRPPPPSTVSTSLPTQRRTSSRRGHGGQSARSWCCTACPAPVSNRYLEWPRSARRALAGHARPTPGCVKFATLPEHKMSVLTPRNSQPATTDPPRRISNGDAQYRLSRHPCTGSLNFRTSRSVNV
jgi:hypothetical protein